MSILCKIKKNTIKQIYNRHNLYFFLFLLLLSFIGCNSNKKIYVLGEKNIYKYNIGVEYYTIAEEYEKLKNYDKAILYYKKCLEFDITAENQIVYKIAYNSALNENWADAIKYYAILLQQDPENQLLKKSIAYVYAKNDNLEKAIEIYAELYSNNSLNQENIENYLYVLIANKDTDTANKIFEEYKTNFPDSENLEKFTELLNTNEEKSLDTKNNLNNEDKIILDK